MARTVIDLDEAALQAAFELFGTTTKVETVNRALREAVRLHRLSNQLARSENPFVGAPVGDEAWR